MAINPQQLQGMFQNPAQVRGQRIDEIMRQSQSLAGLGGSMSGLLGQVAGAGGIAGQMLAEGIAGATGLKTAEDVQAEKNQAIDQLLSTYQPGNLQSMKSTYQRLKDLGAPSRVMIQIASQIQAQEEVVKGQIKQRKATQGAVDYVRQSNPELAALVESGSMDPSEAIKSVQEAKKPIEVGDVLIDVDPDTKRASVVFDARKRNPQSNYKILTDADKSRLGLSPATQYQQEVRGDGTLGKIERIAGAEMPQFGTIPQDHYLKISTGPNGEQKYSMEVIPGSPTADKQAKELQASKNKIANVGSKTNFVTSAIDDALKLVDDPDNWAAGRAGKTIEVLGSLSGGILSAETAQDLLVKKVGVIRANIGFDRLQLMREESPTGGALGQVAIQELYALQNSLDTLDTSVSKPELRKSLVKIKDEYERRATQVANNYTDDQLLRAGAGHLIAYRTGEFVNGEFVPFPTFDLGSLPQEVQDNWEFMNDDEKKLFGWSPE